MLPPYAQRLTGRSSAAETALDAAAHGLRVLPTHGTTPGGRCTCARGALCAWPGKHPRNRTGITGATTDRKKITRWDKQWPDANWAVALGTNGTVVIDIDPRHGGDPHEVIDALGLNDAPTVLTGEATQGCLEGTRGAHVYCHAPGARSFKTDLPGVEVKGEGGYVLLPGSRHVTGVSYEFASTARPWTTPLPPLPDEARRTGADGGVQASPSPFRHCVPRRGEGDQLLADHRAGRFEAVPVPVPDGLPPAVARVAELVAEFAGCRLSVGDHRPLPLAADWVARHVGVSEAAARRSLAALAGWLDHIGALPGRGEQRGTKLYALPSAAIGLDGPPAPTAEASAVGVEARETLAAGTPVPTGGSVQPRTEGSDERVVVGAVPAQGRDAVLPAARNNAHSNVGHSVGSYADTATPTALLRRALADAEPGRRNTVGFKLACALRETGLPRSEAEMLMREYARQVGQPPGKPYTEREALNTTRSAYRSRA